MTTFPGSGTVTVTNSATGNGLLLVKTPQGINWVTKYLGEPGIPADIRRRRRSVYELLRRFGTPVLLKHRYTDDDIRRGDADRSPAFDGLYEHSRNDDPLSHGTGYVSQQKAANEWYDRTGKIVQSAASPGPGWTAAPKYRGYGEGYLTYVIEPDAAIDYFQPLPSGALFKVQTATAQMGWFPDVNDNDLLVNVEIDNVGKIVQTGERYELKQVNPVTMRGSDKRGRRESGTRRSGFSTDGGNRQLINQQFEMTLVPDNHVIYNVECDR